METNCVQEKVSEVFSLFSYLFKEMKTERFVGLHLQFSIIDGSLREKQQGSRLMKNSKCLIKRNRSKEVYKARAAEYWT